MGSNRRQVRNVLFAGATAAMLCGEWPSACRLPVPRHRRRSPRTAAPSRCTSPASHRRRRCRSSTPAGQTVATQSADSLGGLLFRNVTPGTGYRVRRVSDGRESAPLTVHSERRRRGTRASTTSRSRQRLHVPHHPRRHAARDRRAPADEPGGRARPPAGHARSRAVPTSLPPYPTLIEYSGYGYANPAGPANGIAVAREPDGLRGRRREHARHRLLGRRVRLLRAAAEPRRLRRDRDDRPPAVGARTTRSG